MTKKGAVTLIIAGALLTAALAWLFQGFGWWTAPGLLLAAIGAAGLVWDFMGQKDRCLSIGICLILIGLAMLLAVLPQVVLGVLQIISLALIAAGLVLTAVWAWKKRKNAEEIMEA